MNEHFWKIFLGTFVSEDLALIASLTLFGLKEIGFAEAYSACYFGILIGDLGVYWFGRFSKKWRLTSIFGKPGNRLIRKLDNQGSGRVLGALIASSHFIPGSRFLLYFYSGFVAYSFSKFFLISVFSTFAWVTLVFLIGKSMIALFAKNWIALATGTIIGVLFLRDILPKIIDKWDRKALVYRWRRWLTFEFWPAWFFYPPVIFYYFYLAAKNQSISLPLLSNPNIKFGGLVGESKWDIYRHVSGDVSSLSTFLITGKNSHLSQVKELIGEKKILFPFILKPDVGQRGYAVRLINSVDELEEYVRDADFDFVVQEFASLEHEAGIFYYRFPNEPVGEIFSVTEKLFPAVVGDGKSTVGSLILADKRARIIALTYFARLRDDLENVPAKGELIYLTTCGNHCQGAIFLDGHRFITEELKMTFDQIAKKIPEFFVGRFDIKFGSENELKQGVNFKIVEINGCGSEATHIWDPKTKLTQAYSTLFRQWKILFAIGKQVKALGFITNKPKVIDFLREFRKMNSNKSLKVSS